MIKTLYLFLLSMVTFMIVNCTDNNENYTYDMINLKIEQLHTKKDLFFYRTNPNDRNSTIQKANAIIENKKISLMNSLPATKFMGYDYPYELSTVKLYYNSFRTISFLSDAYFLTDKNKYLDKAVSLFTKWKEQEDAGELKNQYVWNDHSTASRTLTLIYLLRVGNDQIDEESRDKIVDSLLQHGNWLYESKNYNDFGNHGVMQDRALLELGIFLSDKSYTKRAIERIEHAFKRDFSKKGVHYENSVDYAKMMLNMYQSLFKLINTKKNLQIISNGNKYLQVLIKPNGEFPLEGDSDLSTPGISKKVFQNFYDLDSGKIIINKENVNHPEKSDYIFFKSGHISSVHKHFDDLSFILTTNGNNVFIDSGKYNYEEEDTFRKYIKSPKAHNTIYIDHTNYSLYKKYYIPKITYYKKSLNYIYAQGVINMHDATLERNLIYSKGVIFLIDRGIFQTPEIMHQNFNISNDVTISSIEQNVTSIQNDNKNITITQHFNVNNVEEFYGDKKNIRGFISQQFNKLIPIHQIDYSIKSKNPVFLTEINTDIDNIKVSDVSFNATTNILHFSIDGEKIKIDLFR